MVVLGALCGAVLLTCALTLVAGLKLTAPAPRIIGPPPATLAGAETVTLASASGAVLRGWLLPPTRPGAGVVLLAHGYRESRGMMVQRAVVLHEQGLGVLLFDFQAHGESTGARITLGAKEGMDLRSAVDELVRRFPGERIGAIGVSLGGAAITLAPHPLAIDAAVLESTFPSVESALRNRLASDLPGGRWLAPVLTPLMVTIMQPILGVKAADLRPIDRIGSLGVPVLLLAGTNDRRTPLPEARDLYDHATEPKQFVEVPGAGHVDLERFDAPAYWAVVMPFLTTHLQRPSKP